LETAITTAITIEAILLGLIGALLSVVIWTGKLYIKRDTEWKNAIAEEIKALRGQRERCVGEFALRKDLDEAWTLIRQIEMRVTAGEVRIDLLQQAKQ